MSPYAADKLRINGNGLVSFWQIIKGYFTATRTVIDGGSMMAEEIEANDWLQEPEALRFLEEQEASCRKVDEACQSFIAAQEEFHADQLDRNNRMRRWIDKKLAQQKQP